MFDDLMPIQVPNNRPLSEYSVLQPLVDDSDAEYTLMDNSSVRNRNMRVYNTHVYTYTHTYVT